MDIVYGGKVVHPSWEETVRQCASGSFTTSDADRRGATGVVELSRDVPIACFLVRFRVDRVIERLRDRSEIAGLSGLGKI